MKRYPFKIFNIKQYQIKILDIHSLIFFKNLTIYEDFVQVNKITKKISTINKENVTYFYSKLYSDRILT